jgi:hypothetical protein
MSTRAIEERHGFPGALGALAGGVRGGRSPLRSKGVGGHVGAARVTEERHGFPGALGALGGVGGHVGAPHVDR